MYTSDRPDQRGPALLVLQPDPRCGPGRVAGWAARNCITLDVRNPRIAAEVPDTVQGFDGLIVLGGEMGDGDTAKYPWLEDVRERLREAHHLGTPTLGICLGAQLLAAALGGEVRRGKSGLETGVVRVLATEKAEEDPLLQGVPEVFYSGAMHEDAIIRLPDEGVLIATGDRYPHQAFRCGSTWGLQFHPEVSPDGYVDWSPPRYASDPKVKAEFDATVEEFRRLDSLVAPSCERLITNFFGVVRAAQTSPD